MDFLRRKHMMDQNYTAAEMKVPSPLDLYLKVLLDEVSCRGGLLTPKGSMAVEKKQHQKQGKGEEDSSWPQFRTLQDFSPDYGNTFSAALGDLTEQSGNDKVEETQRVLIVYPSRQVWGKKHNPRTASEQHARFLEMRRRRERQRKQVTVLRERAGHLYNILGLNRYTDHGRLVWRIGSILQQCSDLGMLPMAQEGFPQDTTSQQPLFYHSPPPKKPRSWARSARSLRMWLAENRQVESVFARVRARNHSSEYEASVVDYDVVRRLRRRRSDASGHDRLHSSAWQDDIAERLGPWEGRRSWPGGSKDSLVDFRDSSSMDDAISFNMAMGIGKGYGLDGRPPLGRWGSGRSNHKYAAGVLVALHGMPLAAALATSNLLRGGRIASGLTASVSGVSVVSLRAMDGLPKWSWIMTYAIWAAAFFLYFWLQRRSIADHRRDWYMFCVAIMTIQFTVGIAQASTSVLDAITIYGPVLLTVSAYLMSLAINALSSGGQPGYPAIGMGGIAGLP